MAEGASTDDPSLVSVLFADVSGSSQMYAERGDAAAFAVMSRCLDLLEEQVRRQQGRVIKRAGDAVLAVFDDAVGAVLAAEGMQQALQSSDCSLRGEGVHVRAGISRGTAVQDAGDIYGDIVNVAARLVSLAGVDEIFLSGEVRDALPPPMRDLARLIDSPVLRGRPYQVPVYEYLWEREDTTAVQQAPAAFPATAVLEVECGAQRFVVDPEHPKLTIGRDPSNDISIPQDVVSRHHATISLRGNQFLVVDRSTNGTYIRTDHGDSFRVLRDELTLAGGGQIFAGSEAVPPIRYRVNAA
jgi:adenylate cyclase